MLALSLAAKNKGWKGAHEWTGDFALDLRSHVKNIGKLLLDYAETDYAIPATGECPAKFSSYPDIWQQVRKCVKAEQMGWVAVGAMAEDLGATDIDDSAAGRQVDGGFDHPLIHTVRGIGYALTPGHIAALPDADA